MEAVHNQIDSLAKPVSMYIQGIPSVHVFATFFFAKKRVELKIPISLLLVVFHLVSKKVGEDSVRVKSVSVTELLLCPWHRAVCFSYTDQRLSNMLKLTRLVSRALRISAH